MSRATRLIDRDSSSVCYFESLGQFFPNDISKKAMK